ncbi:MAG TPA: hypothetical protein VJV79_38630 [Polyangiaceae bacterium]|nr:hypothetical protein [Polyangiaceae bacterium]
MLRLVALKRLGVLLCALALTLSAANTASALEPAQTKTRVWGFDFAKHNSVGLFRAANSGMHQGNRSAKSEVASDSLLAARAGAAGANAARLEHIFGQGGKHALKEFAAANGGPARAYDLVQKAANEALTAGKLPVGPGGIIPSGNAGPIIEVAGTQIRLIGGRVIDGAVRISSFSRMGLP